MICLQQKLEERKKRVQQMHVKRVNTKSVSSLNTFLNNNTKIEKETC